jgi:hypothetical protein
MEYIVPIMSLFQGRVFDLPEQAMAENKYSTGSDIQHEVSISSHVHMVRNGCFDRFS